MDRCDGTVRLGDDDAGAGDEQVGADGAELARGVEIDASAIEARADHEVVVEPSSRVLLVACPEAPKLFATVAVRSTEPGVRPLRMSGTGCRWG